MGNTKILIAFLFFLICFSFKCKEDDKLKWRIIKNHDTGLIQDSISYRIDSTKCDGIWMNYYENSKIRRFFECKNDVQNGLEIWFWEDGKIFAIQSYFKGYLSGISVEYSKTGNRILKADSIGKTNRQGWVFNENQDTIKKGNFLIPQIYLNPDSIYLSCKSAYK